MEIKTRTIEDRKKSGIKFVLLGIALIFISVIIGTLFSHPTVSQSIMNGNIQNSSISQSIVNGGNSTNSSFADFTSFVSAIAGLVSAVFGALQFIVSYKEKQEEKNLN